MATILCIETATTVCSVAIAIDGKVISLKEVNAGLSHSENLTIFIKQACEEAKISLSGLDAIAVSKGPGSYTGLRIGVSTAKGLCYALNKPLIGISTLKYLAGCCIMSHVSHLDSLYLPMIDARRMEVYCAVYDSALNEISAPDAVVVNENSFAEILKSNHVIFCGDGSGKCKPLFENNPNVIFADVNLSASGMVSLAEAKYSNKEFEDVSLFEPFYLKEAAVGKPSHI